MQLFQPPVSLLVMIVRVSITATRSAREFQVVHLAFLARWLWFDPQDSLFVGFGGPCDEDEAASQQIEAGAAAHGALPRLASNTQSGGGWDKPENGDLGDDIPF